MRIKWGNGFMSTKQLSPKMIREEGLFIGKWARPALGPDGKAEC